MRLFIAIFVCISWANLAFTQPNTIPRARHSFTVIAHRGSHLHYPENTLQAYQQAIEDGADYVEIDLRTTKDGKLMSLHDATVDRTTGANGMIKEMTGEEVMALQVKANDSLDKTIYRIPTFEQILLLCKGKIYIYIDFKDASAEATLELLKKYDMQRQVLVYINSAAQYQDWRKVDSQMPLMISLPRGISNPDQLKEFIGNRKPDLLDGGWKDYTPEMIAMALSLRVPVWPDIQGKDESPAIWQQAIDKGFRGLQTDHPLQLIQYLRSNGLRN